MVVNGPVTLGARGQLLDASSHRLHVQDLVDAYNKTIVWRDQYKAALSACQCENCGRVRALQAGNPEATPLQSALDRISVLEAKLAEQTTATRCALDALGQRTAELASPAPIELTPAVLGLAAAVVHYQEYIADAHSGNTHQEDLQAARTALLGAATALDILEKLALLPVRRDGKKIAEVLA